VDSLVLREIGGGGDLYWQPIYRELAPQDLLWSDIGDPANGRLYWRDALPTPAAAQDLLWKSIGDPANGDLNWGYVYPFTEPYVRRGGGDPAPRVVERVVYRDRPPTEPLELRDPRDLRKDAAEARAAQRRADEAVDADMLRGIRGAAGQPEPEVQVATATEGATLTSAAAGEKMAESAQMGADKVDLTGDEAERLKKAKIEAQNLAILLSF